MHVCGLGRVAGVEGGELGIRAPASGDEELSVRLVSAADLAMFFIVKSTRLSRQPYFNNENIVKISFIHPDRPFLSF
ncbi:hypothetical protein J2Z66_005143 [Paenibacillus eucommiae]|uniref:Uncharacterized protein n=1 Tax=Paenibacillus eucommiae TaxID=1355755 RepID=A0ABS4J339_9BACL|nr:hypothetical protein [Paenibacillus eucommiae]